MSSFYSPRPNDKRVNGATAYGLKALRGECELLANTPPNTRRNAQLNNSAFALGQLIASGDLPEQLVVEELAAAARACGLPTLKILGSGTAGTLYSGLNSGKANPRRNV